MSYVTVYNADRFGADSVGYLGPNHTGSSKDIIVLGRQYAKPTAVFSGVNRTTIKWTRTLALTGALTPNWDAIVTVNISIPVGFSGAAVDAIMNDMATVMGHAQTKLLVKNQQIVY